MVRERGKSDTYRDGGAGRVGPIARGGERSQGPAASISSVEKTRSVRPTVECRDPGIPGKPSIFSQTNDTNMVSEDVEMFSRGQNKQKLYSRLTFISTESICPNKEKVNGLIHIIDLSLIHFDKMNTWDNYNGSTQQIQTNKHRKGGGEHSNLETGEGGCDLEGPGIHMLQAGGDFPYILKTVPLIISKEIVRLMLPGEERISRLMAGSSLKWQMALALRKYLTLCSESLKSDSILT